MCLQDLQLQAKSVTVQVLAPSQNSKQITSYSNVREMNQISHLQFCACANSPILYCCKNKENRCSNNTECLTVVDNYQHTMDSSFENFICFVFSDILILMLTNHG